MVALANVTNFTVDTDCLFTWDPVTNAEGYELRVGTDWATGSPLVTVDVTGTSYQHNGVLDAVDVFIKAKAFGYEESVNAASVSTPAAPFIADVVNLGISLDFLTFDLVTDATSYEIRRSKHFQPDIENSELVAIVPDNTPIDVAGDEGYRYYARAFGPCNTRSQNFTSVWSEFETGTCDESEQPNPDVCWKVSCIEAAEGAYRIGAQLIFEENDSPPNYIRLYEMDSVRNPETPTSIAAANVRRYYNTNLCVTAQDSNIFYDAMIQDSNDLLNITKVFGIVTEDVNDPATALSDFSSVIIFNDIPFSNNLKEMIGLIDTEQFLNASKQDGQADSTILQDLAGTAILKLEDNQAQINDRDIVTKVRGNTPGVGRYTIEHAPDGTVLQVDCYIKSDPGVAGVRTVVLPVALPDADENKIVVSGLGISTGIAAPIYQLSSLTTTSIDIAVTNGGIVASNLPTYIHLTWSA